MLTQGLSPFQRVNNRVVCKTPDETHERLPNVLLFTRFGSQNGTKNSQSGLQTGANVHPVPGLDDGLANTGPA